jgi:CubicO group peptidase (beta-lactamase class C family)
MRTTPNPALHRTHLRPAVKPALCLVLLLTGSVSLANLPGAAAIDARVRAAMAETRANGMAIAVIDDGRVAYVQAYGARNAKGDPLQTDTVMYGASITKTVMAYTTLTLVVQGKLDLDAPLADYLERPLISYGEGQTHLAKYGPIAIWPATNAGAPSPRAWR